MSASASARMSRLSSSARPPIRLFAAGTRRSSESAVTVLPEPDSPTIASVSPAWRPNARSLTAGSQPVAPRNEVVNPCTDRTGSMSDFVLQLGIDGIAQAVAEQVEREDHEQDRDARHHREPRAVENVLEAGAD